MHACVTNGPYSYTSNIECLLRVDCNRMIALSETIGITLAKGSEVELQRNDYTFHK